MSDFRQELTELIRKHGREMEGNASPKAVAAYLDRCWVNLYVMLVTRETEIEIDQAELQASAMNGREDDAPLQ